MGYRAMITVEEAERSCAKRTQPITEDGGWRKGP